MSKKYLFNRYNIVTESLSHSERKEKIDQRIKCKTFVSLSLSSKESFVDKLFGVTEFYFFPREKSVSFQKNMMEKLTDHSLFLLTKVSNELNSELYSWMKFCLVGLKKIMNSDGWKNNQLILNQVREINSFFENGKDQGIELVSLSTPVITKKLDFYYNEERELVISSDEIQREDYNYFEPNVVYHKPTYNSVEQLECAINALMDFMITLKPKQSFTNEKISYMYGETDDYIHEHIIFSVKSLSRCLGYMINTTSWNDNQAYRFDISDFERRSYVRISEEHCKYYIANTQKDYVNNNRNLQSII